MEAACRCVVMMTMEVVRELWGITLPILFIGGLYYIVDEFLMTPQQWIILCFDEFCHFVASVVLWTTILSSLSSPQLLSAPSLLIYGVKKRWQEIVVAGVLGCVVDVDHFLAARSLSLYNATHLPARPFGHAVLFILLITLLIYGITSSRGYAAMVFCSLTCHQLRDGLRRGLWLWPLGSTSPLPLTVVLLLYAMLILGVRKYLSLSLLLCSRSADSQDSNNTAFRSPV
eukprot:scaffold3756_cov180-Ochromonas_danica.AAC.8